MMNRELFTFKQLLLENLARSFGFPLSKSQNMFLLEKGYFDTFYRHRVWYPVCENAMYLNMLLFSSYSSFLLNKTYRDAIDVEEVGSEAVCANYFVGITNTLANASCYLSLAVGCSMILIEQFIYWTAIRSHHKIMDLEDPPLSGLFNRLLGQVKSLRQPRNAIHFLLFWAMQISAGTLLNNVIAGWQKSPRDLWSIYLFMMVPGLIFLAGGIAMEWSARRFLFSSSAQLSLTTQPILQSASRHQQKWIHQCVNLGPVFFDKVMNYFLLATILGSSAIKTNLSRYVVNSLNSSASCQSVSVNISHEINNRASLMVMLPVIGIGAWGVNQIAKMLYQYYICFSKLEGLSVLRTNAIPIMTTLGGFSFVLASWFIRERDRFFDLEWQALLGAVLFSLSAFVLNVNADRYSTAYPLFRKTVSRSSDREDKEGAMKPTVR